MLYNPDSDPTTVLLDFQLVLGVSSASTLLFLTIGSDLACPCPALDRSSHMVPRLPCQPCAYVPSRLNLTDSGVGRVFKMAHEGRKEKLTFENQLEQIDRGCNV